MADVVLPQPDSFDRFIQAQGQALHARDELPATRQEWEKRRTALRTAMFAAMGSFPDKACSLEPRVLGVLPKTGYRIEKLIFQSRPDVWVTASAYVPDPAKEKRPAVLVVHGHWAGARRDPVVQARCLGLVKLGFFVLAVDAFGAGERYTEPASGTYHGALYGSTLWPVGQTLLGMQVYDNRRAVDYLLSRPEVDGERLGITGASGGGNQTMYAGALDERFRAVVPVCQVGTYQAYLRTACCVCEVLPGALRFAEEGDVLALTAPRSLLVINASKDGIQFSPGEAEKSVARARAVYKLYAGEDKLKHAVFESGHAYNQPMREEMYGWMTRWLKDEGEGKPIDEPVHEIDKAEDLACFPDKERPKGYLFLPSFAAREARGLIAKFSAHRPNHTEDWESSAVHLRTQLRKQLFGENPKLGRPEAQPGKTAVADEIKTTSILFHPEAGMPVPAVSKSRTARGAKSSACLLLSLDGKEAAFQHPLAKALLEKNWVVLAPDLRATGQTRPAGDTIAGAADHNSAEHALWIGRPLLGQWIIDVTYILDWLAAQPGLDRSRVGVVGIGPAGVVALAAAALLDDRFTVAAALEAPVTYVTEEVYGPKMRMGLLAPGILRWADIPQLAALVAPRRLVVAGGMSPQDEPLTEKTLQEALAFPRDIYKLYKAENNLLMKQEAKVEELATAFG